MATSWKSQGLTSFHIEGLSAKASSYLDIFLNTLKNHYVAPNWIKSKRIEERLGVSGPEVRGMIHYLRAQGHLIASSGQGYCYTSNINSVEIQDTIKHLKERANSMRSAYEGMMNNDVNIKKFKQEEMF